MTAVRKWQATFHRHMSTAAGTASIQLELKPHKPTRRTRCSCRRCCACCCLLVLVAVAVVAFILWPRLLTLCVHYSHSSAKLMSQTTTDIAGATARVEVRMPVSIASTNLWGIKIDLLELTAFYSGNEDILLSRGALEGFELVANGNSSFDLALSPADIGPAQMPNVVDYLTARCGVAWDTGTWLMDLHVLIKAFWGVELSFWLRELQMPCATAATDMPRGASNSGQDSCDEQRAGRYCKHLLCAIDDLECTKELCASPPAAYPLAPPLLASLFSPSMPPAPPPPTLAVG